VVIINIVLSIMILFPLVSHWIMGDGSGRWMITLLEISYNQAANQSIIK
jgi:hypothetical protein